jgi:ABC-type multidrug transport system ATPase subunit
MMQVSVEINNVSKSFGETLALNNLSCSINEGELFGFIGPDGAGKTTLFRILTTLLLADEGYVKVAGFEGVNEYKQIRHNVGYMPGTFSLYQDLTVEENLKFFAGVFKTTIEKNYHLIEDIYKQIEPFKNRRAGKLSGGMKQKLALSCALIHKPKVLFLDEPTTGVDAVSRKEFWEMLAKLKAGGLTIVVSTPYMDEAALCDRVALIQKGEILSIDTPEQIRNSFPFELIKVKAKNMFALMNILKESPQVYSSYLFGEFLHIVLNEGVNKGDFMDNLAGQGVENLNWDVITAGVEDCFMELMNK